MLILLSGVLFWLRQGLSSHTPQHKTSQADFLEQTVPVYHYVTEVNKNIQIAKLTFLEELRDNQNCMAGKSYKLNSSNGSQEE